MKTAVILTGRHEPTKERYEPIAQAFRQAGWEQVVTFTPNWNRRNIQAFVAECLQKIPNDNQPLTLFGFSMGAMLALILSSKIATENLVLCSPSGYFKEYEPLLLAEDRKWAEEYLADFRNWSAKDSISKANVKKGCILAGEKELDEWPDFKQWINDLRTQTQWPLSVIPAMRHEIEAENYQKQITDVISLLQ